MRCCCVGYYLVRREATSLSLDVARSRELLCLQAARPINLLDLRPHAPTWTFLQSLRFAVTRAVADETMAAGFEGIAYRSPQHYGQDCFALFGPALQSLGVIVFFLQIDTLGPKNVKRDKHLQNRLFEVPCAFGAN